MRVRYILFCCFQVQTMAEAPREIAGKRAEAPHEIARKKANGDRAAKKAEIESESAVKLIAHLKS